MFDFSFFIYSKTLNPNVEAVTHNPLFQINCVLVGFDAHLSYAKMIKAATYARQKNNLFLATNEDPFLPTKEKVVIPGNINTLHVFILGISKLVWARQIIECVMVLLMNGKT